MLNTFVVYVENKPGVLTRVASLFRRRAFNIDSLTVGRTEKPEVSRMTITVEADHDQARRIEANLYKLVNVLLVENITTEPALARDLAMIKVAATHEARSHVLELASVFRARVVDVAPESLIIEITGDEDKIDGLLEVLRPYGVLEMVRTGIVAMRRGTNALQSLPRPRLWPTRLEKMTSSTLFRERETRDGLRRTSYDERRLAVNSAVRILRDFALASEGIVAPP